MRNFQAKVIGGTLLLGCFLATVCVAQAEDFRQREAKWRRFDELVHAPRATHSLEWAVDASDAVVTVVVPQSGQSPKLKQTLKPGEADQNIWPVTKADRLRAILSLYQAGDEIILCLRVDRKTKASQVTHYFPLISKKDPRRQGDSNRYYSNLPQEMGQAEKMYTYRKTMHAGFWYLAVDVHGKVIQDDQDLLKRIKQRIAQGSLVPTDCDREAVEQRKSDYGGFYMYVPLPSELSSAEFPLVLVTPEPEFREHFYRPVPEGVSMLPAALVNYSDAEVIASLKRTLSDRMLSQRAWTIPENNLIEQISYLLKPGDAVRKVKGEDDGKVKVVRYFHRRKAAWEMLQRMGVNVERPVLIPKEE